jgi:hypothetical protein
MTARNIRAMKAVVDDRLARAATGGSALLLPTYQKSTTFGPF